jgi:hypothetical protein
MCSFHGVLSGEEIRAIDEWVGEWIEAASAYGWTRLPSGTGDAMIVAMQVCYRRKMTAREAVEFCFSLGCELVRCGRQKSNLGERHEIESCILGIWRTL